MNDFEAKVIGEVLFRLFSFLIELLATSEYADDVLHGLRERWNTRGPANAIKAAFFTTLHAARSRLPSFGTIVREVPVGVADSAPVAFFLFSWSIVYTAMVPLYAMVSLLLYHMAPSMAHYVVVAIALISTSIFGFCVAVLLRRVSILLYSLPAGRRTLLVLPSGIVQAAVVTWMMPPATVRALVLHLLLSSALGITLASIDRVIADRWDVIMWSSERPRWMRFFGSTRSRVVSPSERRLLTRYGPYHRRID